MKDPGFAGFHRIEHALWIQGTTEGMGPVADRLLADDLLAPDRAGREALFRTLTDRIAYLTNENPVPQVPDPRLPPPESGLMGAQVPADALTITVAVGVSLFEEGAMGWRRRGPQSWCGWNGFQTMRSMRIRRMAMC